MAGLVWLSSCGPVEQAGSAVETVAPRDRLEVCFDLAPGYQLEYEFNCGATVKFDVHYHRGDEVIYRVAEQLVTGKQGRLIPNTPADYCLMWNNSGASPVTINYAYSVTRTPP